MDTLPHYQNTDHEPPGRKFHTHQHADGTVSVCWTDGVSSGERFYRWISDLGPHRVAGHGDALPGELQAIALIFPG